ncbi:4Fe-4S binding protein [Desulfosediminicola ganghwensis]|uniref:4Fe-4S binding protein n=1 Tax=Desulfosediminicola ganghwensis TaxID=2569540 RepID=UPI0010AC0A2C|nr:4Fe-4S binding protein [Desulfosediminicola ganghwensis]
MKKSVFFLLPSTRRFFRVGRRTMNFSLKNLLNGYIYGRWIYHYIGFGTREHSFTRRFPTLTSFLFKIFNPSNKSTADNEPVTFADTYHGKVICLDEAKKIVTLNKKIDIQDLEQVIPYKLARSIILENPLHLAVLDCPCRLVRQKHCKPVDVCIIAGEVFTSFVLEHHPDKSRKISVEEAVEISEAEHRRGHVHHAFFKSDLFGRFYAICNCCGCCCGALQAWQRGTPMLASSGYVCKADQSLCTGCGVCVRFCQFGALSLEDGRIVIDEERCLGCGVCVSKCKENARWLELDPSRGTPLDLDALTN